MLTTNEAAVMLSLKHNHYGTDGDGVWAWAINDSQKPSGITGKELSGVVGSLAKKGYLTSEEYDRGQNVIYMTELGAAYMQTID
jgi:hypothetical protein